MPLALDAEAAPQRIVSLNLCTDQILVELVPRERIAALSILVDDRRVSPIAGRFPDTPKVRGEAEQVLALDADLVVTVASSTPATVALLRRLDRAVVTVPLASSFEEIRSVIRTLAEAVAEPQKGRKLIDRMDHQLAALRAPDARRPSAIALQVGSLVSSGRSLLDEAMAWVGLDNAAGRRRLGAGGRLPLEALVADPPDLIVLANDPAEFRTAAADNLRHPALAAVLARTPHARLPLPSWLCGGPAILDAVARLAAARAALPPTGARP
jgi:iron complex transport system substrate-binding protein